MKYLRKLHKLSYEQPRFSGTNRYFLAEEILLCLEIAKSENFLTARYILLAASLTRASGYAIGKRSKML